MFVRAMARWTGVLVLLTMAAACSKSTPPPEVPPRTIVPPGEVPLRFEQALNALVEHDERADWTAASCNEVAGMFEQLAAGMAADQKERRGVCLYNAGLAYQRCGLEDRATQQFEAAVQVNPSMHRATVQLAMQAYREQGDALLDATIDRVQAAVIAAKFQDTDALVNLAMLQMKRRGPQAQPGCADDMSCAKLNVQRALAIDDGYMPAFNQLALLYLAKAKAKAGATSTGRHLVTAQGKTTELSTQMLDLAALVCSQAIRRNARYAPIHNTLGLIQVELRNTNRAVKAFDDARRLDPDFFEAHMNYAAVNLSFRGYDEAEAAYRDALRIRPRDYEASLGLALAIRGQMNAMNVDRRIDEVREHLGRAKSLDESRPEAYFNEGILIQEYEAKFAERKEDKIASYRKALSVFETFLSKAGEAPEYADAITNAKERVVDINQMIRFFESS